MHRNKLFIKIRVIIKLDKLIARNQLQPTEEENNNKEPDSSTTDGKNEFHVDNQIPYR